MHDTELATLDSFFADPVEPRWSSYAMDQLFAGIHGNTKARLQQILPRVDDRLFAARQLLTATQTNFLRDITVRHFLDKSSTPFTADELSWLIGRFEACPTPHRALLITLLLPSDELSRATSDTIRAILTDTTGQRWLE